MAFSKQCRQYANHQRQYRALFIKINVMVRQVSGVLLKKYDAVALSYQYSLKHTSVCVHQYVMETSGTPLALNFPYVLLSFPVVECKSLQVSPFCFTHSLQHCLLIQELLSKALCVFISAIEVRTARLVFRDFFFFLLIWIQLLQHFMLCLNLASWVLPLALFLCLRKTFLMQLVGSLSSDGLICLEVESRVQSPDHFVC